MGLHKLITFTVLTILVSCVGPIGESEILYKPRPYKEPFEIVRKANSRSAFSVLTSNGDVVSWGNQLEGGDSTLAFTDQSESESITKLYGNTTSIIALSDFNNFYGWGETLAGADTSSVFEKIDTSVTLEIFTTERAYSVLTSTGDVYSWGDEDFGGDNTAVANSLEEVTGIYSTGSAFAALTEEEEVFTWGDQNNGGDSSGVASFADTLNIFSTRYAFTAIKDGMNNAEFWGDPLYGGSAAFALQQIIDIGSTDTAFAAITATGQVATWGDATNGGDSSAVSAQLTNISYIVGTKLGGFIAVTGEGAGITWGNANFGGNSAPVAASLTTGIDEVFATDGAFAALMNDGTVVTWGDSFYGGDSSLVQSELKNVEWIYTNKHAFAAKTDTGKIITWGALDYGGDSSAEAEYLSADIEWVVGNDGAFMAYKKEENLNLLEERRVIVTWGDPNYGGDSSSVKDKLEAPEE